MRGHAQVITTCLATGLANLRRGHERSLDDPDNAHEQGKNDIQESALHQRCDQGAREALGPEAQTITHDHHADQAGVQIHECSDWHNDRDDQSRAVADVQRSAHERFSTEAVETVAAAVHAHPDGEQKYAQQHGASIIFTLSPDEAGNRGYANHHEPQPASSDQGAW